MNNMIKNNKILKYKNRKKGQSLIEVVLSIGVLAIVITALTILSTFTLKTSKSSTSRSEAVKLANAGIEAVRYVRDAEECGLDVFAKDFTSTTQKVCYTINVTSGALCGALDKDVNCDGNTFESSGQEYNRKIEISKYDGKSVDDIILVKSIVTWQESVGEKKVVLTSVLADIYK